MPAVDAIYLPGGYPELHAEALVAGKLIAAKIREHVNAGKPLLAECGGMLYLADTLADLHDKKHAMLGVLPGAVSMGKRLAALGPQQLNIDDGIAQLRGHTFHYSSFTTALPPAVARGYTRWPQRRSGISNGEHSRLICALVLSFKSNADRQLAARKIVSI